eukprot:scaffold83215_cov48-Phaeocystis_antarctica.AAC.1
MGRASGMALARRCRLVRVKGEWLVVRVGAGVRARVRVRVSRHADATVTGAQVLVPILTVADVEALTVDDLVPVRVG